MKIRVIIKGEPNKEVLEQAILEFTRKKGTTKSAK